MATPNSDRLGLRNLQWRDFIPEGQFSIGDFLFVLGGVYFFCMAPARGFVHLLAWAARELGNPLAPDDKTRLAFLGAGILDAVLLGFIFLFDAQKNAWRRIAREERENKIREDAAKRRKKKRAKASLKRSSARAAEQDRPPNQRQGTAMRIATPDEYDDPSYDRYGDYPNRRSPPSAQTLVRLDREEPPEPEPPLPPGLSETQWHSLQDATALLDHAIPRIPVRYTCLVLSHLAEVLWTEWDRRLPQDWRPGWCLAVTRAWCFGEATLSDVDAACEQARLAFDKVGPGSTYPAFAAVMAVRSVALYPGFERLTEVSTQPARELVQAFIHARETVDAEIRAASEAYYWGKEQTAPLPQIWGELANATKQRCQSAIAKRVSAYLSELLRQYIPYPSRRSTEWKIRGSLLCAGDAVLALNGWRIVQAVPVPTKPRYPRGGWN